MTLGVRADMVQTRTGMDGVNFSNSMTQLLRTDNGQTMRKGPHVPFDRRWARNEMVCRVCTSSARARQRKRLRRVARTLPRPISSARIPLSPFSYSEIIHCTPASW